MFSCCYRMFSGSDSTRSCRERLADTCRHWIHAPPAPQPHARAGRRFWSFRSRHRQVGPGGPPGGGTDAKVAPTPPRQAAEPATEDDARRAASTPPRTQPLGAAAAAKDSACAPAAVGAGMAASTASQTPEEGPSPPRARVENRVDVSAATEPRPAPPQAWSAGPQAGRAVLRLVVHLPTAYEEDTTPSASDEDEDHEDAAQGAGPLPWLPREEEPRAPAPHSQTPAGAQADPPAPGPEDQAPRPDAAHRDGPGACEPGSDPREEEEESPPRASAVWRQVLSLTTCEENPLPPVANV